MVRTYPTELLTARLRLRTWRDEDFAPLLGIYQDPGYLEHMPAMDEERTRLQLERFRLTWEIEGFGLWAVEDRETGEFLGRIGVTRQMDWTEEPGAVEVGWTLGPTARGRGLATEGGRAAVESAFHHLDLERVISITTPANAPSRNVMTKLGLTYRGESHWHDYDVVWYAVERADWSPTVSPAVT